MNKEEIKDMVSGRKAVLLYITNPWCVSCKSLRPKIEQMTSEDFPKIEFQYIDASVSPETTAELHVFSAPTILVFFDGREYIRESKFVSVEELRSKIRRIYNLMFDE